MLINLIECLKFIVRGFNKIIKMKKQIMISMLGLILLFSVVNVSATPGKFGSIKLLEKDSNWDIVDGGAYGKLSYSSYLQSDWYPCMEYRGRTVSCKRYIWKDKLSLKAYKLEPKTKYTLVYYGDEEHNDVYPYVTCLKTKKSNRRGKLFFRTSFDRMNEFITDDKEQKFWLVKKSDVNCNKGELKSWNPSEYLFENNVI